MKLPRLHLPSLLTGLGLGALAFLTLGNAATVRGPARSIEYRIVDDPDEKRLEELAKDGWEYAGYLGQGTKGSGNDQTLWQHTGE